MKKEITPAENIDQAELAKFTKMANQWWDYSGPCKPLHEINPIRLQFITDHTELVGKDVIDVGCGGGILSESLAQSGAKVTGIDLNHDLITVAKLHLHESKLNIHYYKKSVNNFASQNPHKFNVVTCMELLEHVPNPHALLSDCARLLKPNGKLFISTINRNFTSYLKAILAAEYLLKMLPSGTHDYDKFIKPSELCAAAREFKLELFTLKGLDYNPFKKVYFAVDDVSVNYMAGFKLT